MDNCGTNETMPMTEFDNRPHSERFREAGEAWADLEAAAQILEDTKSATLAQWASELGDIPVNRAEQIVKASQRWIDLVTKIVNARHKANAAKVHMEVARMEFGEMQSKEATSRAEMRMTV